MSEKIYACLLRLYPARFRRKYQAEALQLFCDRLHDERGLVRRLRLWIDLLADFAFGLPLAYRNAYTQTAVMPIAQRADGLPSFRTLEEEPLRPGSVVMGGVLAVATLAAFIFVMNHFAAYLPFSRDTARLSAASTGFASNDAADQGAAENLKAQGQSVSPLEACSFQKLEQHPGNIGYVKLSWFADPPRCRDTARAVMQRLNETDAIIFDLRDCHGGYPEMVRWMASWFFDHPVAWYNPRAIVPAQTITASPVPGSHLADKPLFVLTSPDTFSGGEHFAYNLKMLKRATIIGEKTSGASHAGPGPTPSRVAVSEQKPIWEGTGVQPDVQVKAAAALAVAEKLALAALHKGK